MLRHTMQMLYNLPALQNSESSVALLMSSHSAQCALDGRSLANADLSRRLVEYAVQEVRHYFFSYAVNFSLVVALSYGLGGMH